MLTNPQTKYAPFSPIRLPDRTWPQKTISAPPVWLSTDLRDGNQALAEPMTLMQKLRLFHVLVDIGFKEIEIGFPSASQTDFDFTRHLIEHRLIPQDVTIQVLTPAREALIRRTFDALQGADAAIVHVYNATAPTFREVVFNLDKAGTVHLATAAARLIRSLALAQPQTAWRFQYSPEVFTSTELSFAKEICNAVLDIWQPTADAKAIINLPASVEVSTPNVFADQVEWMHRNLHYRDSTVLCVHPHNDRGCSVAAAELAQLAGAQRVEGCLFGNGERTGNVDLVTLAMNLYTQGISPGLDFSQIDTIVRAAEDCTQLPIHPRHPYAGELVFTAFSGSHQDAIRKGFAARSSEDIWSVPYLPMDPADVGRSYESVVRVNSQSGKGGVAFLLERECGLLMPRSLQVAFSRLVQQTVDRSSQELTPAQLWNLFREAYCVNRPLHYVSHQDLSHLSSEEISGQTVLSIELCDRTKCNNRDATMSVSLCGKGSGPIDAFVSALNNPPNHALNVDVSSLAFLSEIGNLAVCYYEEKSLLSAHSDANVMQSKAVQKKSAIALIEVSTAQGNEFGVGIHESIVVASFQAILSALNRLLTRSPSVNVSSLHM